MMDCDGDARGRGRVGLPSLAGMSEGQGGTPSNHQPNITVHLASKSLSDVLGDFFDFLWDPGLLP